MNNSELIKFLSIAPDKETDGTAPIELRYEYGTLILTHHQQGMLVQSSRPLPSTDEKWSIMVDHTSLMEELSKFNAKDEATLFVKDGDLCIAVGQGKITLSPKGNPLEFDPDLLELDSQTIALSGQTWTELVAAAQVAKSAKEDQPEIIRRGIQLEFDETKQSDWTRGSVTAHSGNVWCYRIFHLQAELTENRRFILPIKVVDVVKKMKPSTIKMTTDYKLEQILIETDRGYVLADLIQGDFSFFNWSFDAECGKQWLSEESLTVYLEKNKKDFQDAIAQAVKNRAKNVKLIFNNQSLTIESSKTKKISIPTEPYHEFTATVTVPATALLGALKTIPVNHSVFLDFPEAGVHTFKVNTVTGIMYIFFVAVEVDAHIVESSKEILKEPKPERQEVSRGKNEDGSKYVVELVEQSPLEEVLPIEEQEKKREELGQKYGFDKVELAEAVDTAATLRKKVKKLIKNIDSEIAKIQEHQTNAVKLVKEKPDVKDLAQENEKFLTKCHQQLEELQLLKEKLQQVVTEAEDTEADLGNYSNVYTLTIEKLKEMSLKMLWWGGRTIEFLFKEEKTWHLELKIIEPQRR